MDRSVDRRRIEAVSVRQVVVALVVLVVPLLPVLPRYVGARFPYPGDGLGNLAPAYHVRHDPGALFYTDLWYGGYAPVLHPYAKVFYPPWWPTYLPGLELGLVLKLVLYAHVVAAVAVGYYYARERLAWYLALPLTLLAVNVAGGFTGHLWKWLALPWLVAFVWQLAPWRARAWDRGDGCWMGLCLAAMLLTGGGVYYAVYGTAVLVPFLLQFGDRETATGLGLGLLPALLKLPAYATSLGGPRPGVGWQLDLVDVLAGLTGVATRFVRPVVGAAGPQIPFGHERFAVIGLPAVLLGVAAWGLRAVDEPSTDWWTALFGAFVVLVAFVTGAVQQFLPVEMLRTAARANHVVALCVLLSVAVLARAVADRRGQVATWAVAGLLVLSVVQAGATTAVYDRGDGGSLGAGPEVADAVATDACGPVWIQDDRDVYDHYRVQVALAKAGIPLVNPRYAEGFVPFHALRDGDPTFGTLVADRPVDGESVVLNRTYFAGTGGRLDADRLTHVRTVRGERETWYLYRTDVANC